MNEDAIRRIKKCLALSESDNEHEAAAALRQAQKMMTAYGITAEALADSEVSSEYADTTVCRQPSNWELRLAHLLSRAFGCEHYFKKGIFVEHDRRRNTLGKMHYIGLKRNAVMAAYAHQVLSRQLVRAREKYMADYVNYRRGDKITLGDSFSCGFVDVLGKQVSAVSNPAPIQAAIENKAKTELGEHSGLIGGRDVGFAPDAYADGNEEGKKAHLHRAMNPGAEQHKLENRV